MITSKLVKIVVNNSSIRVLPDYILVGMKDYASGLELDRRFEAIREDLEMYEEFNSH